MPHDASILSIRPHCCFLEVVDLSRRCTRLLQHTQKVEVPASTGAQVVHITLPAELTGDHYPQHLGAPPIVIGRMSLSRCFFENDAIISFVFSTFSCMPLWSDHKAVLVAMTWRLESLPVIW